MTDAAPDKPQNNVGWNEAAIVALSVAAAVLYGILHDQITVRVCLEYFTVFHDLPFASRDPTVIALLMGILATWWVGLPLGIGLMLAARSGSLPKRSAADLIRPFAVLLVVMGCFAATAGFVGYRLALAGHVTPPGDVPIMLPAYRHAVFIADWWAHLASYAGGVIGGVTLMMWVLWSRYREKMSSATRN